MEQGFGSDIHGNAWTGIHGIVVPKVLVRTRMTTGEWWLLWQWARSIIENPDSDSQNDWPRNLHRNITRIVAGLEQGCKITSLGFADTLQKVKRTTKLAIVLEPEICILKTFSSYNWCSTEYSLSIQTVKFIKMLFRQPLCRRIKIVYGYATA